VSSTAKVTVKAKQTAVNVHDSTLYVGEGWNPEDNFDSALDKDGNPVNFDQITVDGTVDTSKAGTYDVTYTYDGVSSTAKITVKAKTPIEPEDPDNPSESITPTKPNNNNFENTKIYVSNSEESKEYSNVSLPNTGEENNSTFIFYGIGIIAALISFIIYKGKRRKS
uniref:bacterial Ig-like domain-containing protein n=1 Tax=Lactococcus garvieae TaxID=1363 RepID=UPI0022E8C82C